MALNSRDLQHFIDTHGIDAAILAMDQQTSTVPDAARVLGVDPRQIIKSLVFIARDDPLLVIGHGETRIDRRQLAGYLGIGRRWLRLASAEQALEITGYRVGSMPPFGHKQRLRTVMEAGVSGLAVVFGGGGDINAMMRLRTTELLRVTAAEAAWIC